MGTIKIITIQNVSGQIFAPEWDVKITTGIIFF